MHGDFSRGHRPDSKRGLAYTRGFAQQRRLLLDSDLNSMTDALHERLRRLANHSACPQGSPDLGFLLTPGLLLALFDSLDNVVASSSVTFYRDYSRKYLDRFPSLFVAADQGAAGSITIRLRAAANGPTAFWCRAEAATVVQLNGGVNLNVPAGEALQRATATLANVTDLQISLTAGQEIWIGLVEEAQNSTLAPLFSIAAGSYYLNGLPLLQPADADFAKSLLPPAANLQVANPPRNLQNGDLLLAYLEAFERHVSFAEDPGIVENALGGDSDTTTRGRSTGVVKLALAGANFDAVRCSAALLHPTLPTGTLNVTTPPAPINPDPCALPAQGGYTGADNRLYRFEVHTGGALGTALLKWSRDNGAELFPAVEAPNLQTLVFASNTLLQPGDLVEVLTADSIELGDTALATLDANATSFSPPTRATGTLALLAAGPSLDTGVAFTLRTPDGAAVMSLPAHYTLTGLKARRWHGLIQTVAAPDPNEVEIENGITLSLSGTFAPLDYWQYEARTASENANGPFQTSPHGPERNFAPLALFRFQAANQPLVLVEWLDHRFPPLCGLTADDIAFDGTRIGSDSNTVQEVIEEIWERSSGGCCDFTIEPAPGDTAALVRQILLETTGDVTICFKPGVYNFSTRVDISGRKVTLKGCPHAVLADTGAANPMFRLLGKGRLEIAGLTLFGRAADKVDTLVALAPNASLLEAHQSSFIIAGGPAESAGAAIRGTNSKAPSIKAGTPVPLTKPAKVKSAGPAIRLEACFVAAGYGVLASSVSSVDLFASAFVCADASVYSDVLANTAVANCDLTAGVSLAATQTWTAASLFVASDALLDDLGASIATEVPKLASIAIGASAVAASRVQNCRLRAGYGIAATTTQDLDLLANRYECTRGAIHFVDAEQTHATEERLLNLGGTGNDFGIQVIRSGSFSISGCAIDGFATAIAIGAAAAGQASRNFTELDVRGNLITGASVGVVLGPPSGAAYQALLRHIVFDGNTVTASHVAFLFNCLNGEPEKSVAQVRALSNTVTARLGFGVLGQNVELRQNRIHLIDGKSRFFGIVAEESSALIVDCCHLELRASSGPDSALTNPLTTAQATPAGHFAQYIAGASQSQNAAIHLVRGSGAAVSSCLTVADGPRDFFSLRAATHPSLLLSANDFRSGPVRCEVAPSIQVRANSIAGGLFIHNSNGGIVSDNRVTARAGDFIGQMDILLAQGEWQVVANRSTHLSVTPPVTTSGFNWGTYYTGRDASRIRASSLTAFRTLALLSGEAELDALAGGASSALLGLAAEDVAPNEAAYAVANTDWAAGYVAAIEDMIVGGLFDDIAVAIPDFQDIIIIQSRENSFHLMFANNWAESIMIGNPGSVPNSQSVLQVIGNRAADELRVLAYPRMVLALNAADSYPAAGAPTVPAATLSNVEF